jgi:1-aminocyclopropane-1-carboxylate deaminase/D-cysteine desulfhydrase-like pyridoxal-dependent ACC family enzyme
MKLSSTISSIVLEDREFLVKRDDLIDPYLAGNKYRKLYKLLSAPKEKYTKIISYGGTQSNAMLAIASLCEKKGWVFEYYTKKLSDSQKQFTKGNYANALRLGMKHIEIEHHLYKQKINEIRLGFDESVVVIDQGGADTMALEGLAVLADEIRNENLALKSLATPSGTGTTALYLALALPEFRVYTIACVGDKEYLQTQMSALHKIPENLTILELEKKHHFAKPYKEFFDIYKQTKDAGVEFDLLYAPAMWIALLEQTKESVLYIHSGGVTGNESMLERYRHKGLA